MSIDKTIEELIKKYISNQISKTEKEYLLQRAEQDSEIASMLQIHNSLSDEQLIFAMADDKEFQKMRSLTLSQIRRKKKNKAIYSFSEMIEKLLLPFRIPAFSIPIALIFFIGGLLLRSTPGQDDFLNSVNYTSAQPDNPAFASESPLVFSNANFREKENGQILVSFDVERHLELYRDKNDPLVKEILAQSLLNSNTPWQRLRNISDSETIMAPKIKAALIKAMLKDNNQIVRQKSLTSLMNYPNDKEIQNALLQVLVDEESVYMRLAAIDYLSDNKVSAAIMEKELQSFGMKDPVVNQKIKQLKLEQNWKDM